MPGYQLPMRGKGLHGPTVPRRHRKVLRDNIKAITKGDIRRLARRGGVYRVQRDIYDAARNVLEARLKDIIKNLTIVLGNSSDPNHEDGRLEGVYGKRRRTVTTKDVIFVLYRMGSPVYGFDPPYTGARRGAIVH
ncbi:hypothetical protein CLAIMM_09736 [Cladophialophora immunda]|nr:hypothetical protein CLAIMM_09736 [Cladophialophora immunda]